MLMHDRKSSVQTEPPNNDKTEPDGGAKDLNVMVAGQFCDVSVQRYR